MVDMRFREVVIDCAEPPRLAEWWAAFTGYTVHTRREEWSTIVSDDGAMTIGFQQVPEGKVVKNRVHIDFWAADEETTAREIEMLGARRLWISDDPHDPFVVLADPEGNEFCIIRGS